MEADVFGAHWVSLEATQGQAVSDDQGGQPFTRGEEPVVGEFVVAVTGEGVERFFDAFENALKHVVERGFNQRGREPQVVLGEVVDQSSSVARLLCGSHEAVGCSPEG